MTEASTDDPCAYLGATCFIDSDHPRVREFAKRASASADTSVGVARDLFLAVRDGLRYNPNETLIYRELLQIGSVFVESGGLHVRVERRFVSLIRELMSLPDPLGRQLDVFFSSLLSGPEAPKLLGQFLMPSS